MSPATQTNGDDRVELIYDHDCPNVPEARANLRQALCEATMEPIWREWRRDDPNAPDYVRRFGSPTILVDGKDVVADSRTADGACCRVYQGRDGSLRGAPEVAAILAALRNRSAGE